MVVGLRTAVKFFFLWPGLVIVAVAHPDDDQAVVGWFGIEVVLFWWVFLVVGLWALIIR